MKLSLSTGSLYHFPLSLVFSLAKEVGFDGVELVVSLETAVRGLDHVRKLTEGYRLPVLSLHPPMMRLPGWGNRWSIAGKSIQWANELGCQVVTFHPPPAVTKDGDVWAKYVEIVQQSKANCRNGVRLAIENRVYLPGTKAGKEFVLDGMPELEEFAISQDLSFTLDTSHAWVTEGDVIDPYERFRDRLVNVHFSDVNARQLPGSMLLVHSVLSQHQVPGTGVANLKPLLEAVIADGYEGILTLELSPVALRAWTVGSARKMLRKALAYCEEPLRSARAAEKA